MRTRPLRRRALARAAVVLLTATTSLAACSSEPSAPAKEGEATLSLAVQNPPASLDPTKIGTGQDSYLWTAVYDTLLYMDNKGQLQPNAAESWKYSADGRTLTLKLRPGMTFSSGAAVDAAAVKATLERSKSTPGGQQGKLQVVTSIDNPDATTVVITFATPNTTFVENLAIAGIGAIADPATVDNKESALNPVGSGPYTLDKNGTVNGSTYVLQRRDDHWNAKAYPFKTVKVKVIADRTATVNALRAGEIDAGTLQADQVKQIEAAGLGVKLVDATATLKIVMADRAGSQLKALGDKRVRQAVNMAFDRAKMVQQLTGGAGKATTQIFNPKLPGYDAALDRKYPYDVAKAKSLMAEAGYADGFTVTMPSLVFTTPFEPSVAQALGDIGVKVTWEPVPAQNMISAVMSKKYPMFLFIDGVETPSQAIAKAYEPAGYVNPFRAQDPALTTLMAQATAALDATKQAEAYRGVNTFVVENAWDAPLFYIGTNWATKKGITYLGDGSQNFATVRTFGISS